MLTFKLISHEPSCYLHHRHRPLLVILMMLVLDVVLVNINVVDAFQQHHSSNVVGSFQRRTVDARTKNIKNKPLLLFPTSSSSPTKSKPKSSTKLFVSATTNNNNLLSLDQTSVRDVDSFINWALNTCGVQTVDGFYLGQQDVDSNLDYFATTSTGGTANSLILRVPSEMILSSSQIQEEYSNYIPDACYQVLREKDVLDKSYREFFLFLKLLMEYQNGMNSVYYPWLNSMPRKWNTAASFDYFCMSTLPPYIKGLANEKRDELKAFTTALQNFEYINQDIKSNDEILKFIYNVVQTRSYLYGDDITDLRIAPMVDYINHDYPANAEIRYDGNGNCEVYLTQDIPPNTPITINYGSPTNPSKLLTKYGFLVNPGVTYCKLIIHNPSQKLIDIGYSEENMVFNTVDGSISGIVWDVLLYDKLEKTAGMSQIKNKFYEAHCNNDVDTKNSIHAHYYNDTINELLMHVDKILKEVTQLTQMMIQFQNNERHPRLPLLYQHHNMVIQTFTLVRQQLLAMMQ